MTTYYVEAGISGYISSRLLVFCEGGAHTNFNGWANALDWATTDGGIQRIECAPSSNIKSIRTFHRLGMGCLNAGCTGGIDNAVEVHFYTHPLDANGNNTGFRIARALYVHVNNILVGNNVGYNVSPPSYKSIGWINPTPPAGHACLTCYTGPHVHMQSDSVGALVPGKTDCWDPISCCGTQQYQFVY
jgi:hypothetical protein